MPSSAEQCGVGGGKARAGGGVTPLGGLIGKELNFDPGLPNSGEGDTCCCC